MALQLRPISYREAAEYVNKNHRHHKAPTGHKFSVAVYDGEKLCGVAMAGRPVSRYLDNGLTIEINRVCTDGTKNACSMLYSACWRAAQALGYKRIYTYTLETESGASLRAAGFACEGEAGGKNWTGERYRQMEMFPVMKIRWAKYVSERRRRI